MKRRRRSLRATYHSRQNLADVEHRLGIPQLLDNPLRSVPLDLPGHQKSSRPKFRLPRLSSHRDQLLGSMPPRERVNSNWHTCVRKKRLPQPLSKQRVTKVSQSAAERTGFEPVKPLSRLTGLAIRRFRPLSHLSQFLADADNTSVPAAFQVRGWSTLSEKSTEIPQFISSISPYAPKTEHWSRRFGHGRVDLTERMRRRPGGFAEQVRIMDWRENDRYHRPA